jgi:hypothetical protein
LQSTLGLHASGAALLATFGFDIVKDDPSPAEAGEAAATAGAVETTTPPTPDGTEGSSKAEGETSVPPVGDEPAKEVAVVVYRFVGGDSVKAVLNEKVSVLFAVMEEPMPSLEGLEPESAEEPSDPREKLLRKLVPSRWFDVSDRGRPSEVLSRAFVAKLTDHPGTLIALLALALGEDASVVERVIGGAQQVATLLDKSDDDISEAMPMLPPQHLNSLMFKMAADVATCNLGARWTAALLSNTVTPKDLADAILKKLGKRLRSRFGADVDGKLEAGIDSLAPFPLITDAGKLQGVELPDAAELERIHRAKALAAMKISDSDVMVKAVPVQSSSKREILEMTKTIVMRAHELDLARRLKDFA